MSPAVSILLLIGLSTGALSGCETVERRSPVVSDPAVIRQVPPARAWEVDAGGELVGHVVYFGDRAEAGSAVYMVRNPWHQDLGLIDAFGRAYRFLPHHRDPAWIGTGTVRQGVARILELAEEDCRLDEVEVPTAGERGAASTEEPES